MTGDIEISGESWKRLWEQQFEQTQDPRVRFDPLEKQRSVLENALVDATCYSNFLGIEASIALLEEDHHEQGYNVDADGGPIRELRRLSRDKGCFFNVSGTVRVCSTTQSDQTITTPAAFLHSGPDVSQHHPTRPEQSEIEQDRQKVAPLSSGTQENARNASDEKNVGQTPRESFPRGSLVDSAANRRDQARTDDLWNHVTDPLTNQSPGHAQKLGFNPHTSNTYGGSRFFKSGGIPIGAATVPINEVTETKGRDGSLHSACVDQINSASSPATFRMAGQFYHGDSFSKSNDPKEANSAALKALNVDPRQAFAKSFDKQCSEASFRTLSLKFNRSPTAFANAHEIDLSKGDTSTASGGSEAWYNLNTGHKNATNSDHNQGRKHVRHATSSARPLQANYEWPPPFTQLRDSSQGSEDGNALNEAHSTVIERHEGNFGHSQLRNTTKSNPPAESTFPDAGVAKLQDWLYRNQWMILQEQQALLASDFLKGQLQVAQATRLSQSMYPCPSDFSTHLSAYDNSSNWWKRYEDKVGKPSTSNGKNYHDACELLDEWIPSVGQYLTIERREPHTCSTSSDISKTPVKADEQTEDPEIALQYALHLGMALFDLLTPSPSFDPLSMGPPQLGQSGYEDPDEQKMISSWNLRVVSRLTVAHYYQLNLANEPFMCV